MDLDAVGGAATAGLAAGALERPAGVSGEPHAACADCGAQTFGRFCHNCGNPTHVHRTLLHLGEELLHGVMHFDSRAWRTLPMLAFRPGRLTREWVHGKRARYVSPLALFLFTIFVMFMALSYLPQPKVSLAEQRAVAAAKLASARTEAAEARTAVANAAPQGRADAQARLRVAEAEAADAADRLAVLRSAAEPGDWKGELNAAMADGRLKIDTGDTAFDEKLRHKLENPELALYKLQQTFYKFSFLLVPISIPFVALLFLWKRGFTLYDHGVFVLYSLTFMSLLVMAVATVNRISGDAGSLAFTAALLGAPAHMFFQLKGAYGLRIGSAAWRTVLLLMFCLVALAIFALSVIWLGLG